MEKQRAGLSAAEGRCNRDTVAASQVAPGRPPDATSRGPEDGLKIAVALGGRRASEYPRASRDAATESFTNPAGNVLGAFVAAMLYDTLGPALLATLEPDQFQSTLDLNVRFLRPVQPGRLVGRGRVAHRDGDMASLEASLHGAHDAQGAVIATATATARVIPASQARSAV